MAMTYEEASEHITGPGQFFEMGAESINGIGYRVFKNGPSTLAELFAGSRDYESTFLVYEEERWSFRETARHIDAMADALVNVFGVKKGDRVGIAMRNLPEWIVSFAAVLSIGAVSVSFNAWWTAAELEYALKDSGSSVLIVDRERIDRARAAAEQREVPIVAVRVAADGTLPSGVHRYEDVVTLGHPMPSVQVLPDDDATILYVVVRNDGPPEGSRLDSPCDHAVLDGVLGPGRHSDRPPRRRTRDANKHAAVFHPHRAPIPCDGLRPCHALVLRSEDEARDDVSLGPRSRASLD